MKFCVRALASFAMDVVRNELVGMKRSDGSYFPHVASKRIDGEIIDFENYHLICCNMKKFKHRKGYEEYSCVQSILPSEFKGEYAKLKTGWSTVVARNMLFLNWDSYTCNNTSVFDETEGERAGNWAPCFDFEYCLGDEATPYTSKKFRDLFRKNIKHIPQDVIDRVATLTDAKIAEFTWFGGCEEFFSQTTKDLEAIQVQKIKTLTKQRDFILDAKVKDNFKRHVFLGAKASQTQARQM